LNHNFEETDRRIMGIQTGKPNPNEEIDDFFD
jgi:hypothetical protein